MPLSFASDYRVYSWIYTPRKWTTSFTRLPGLIRRTARCWTNPDTGNSRLQRSTSVEDLYVAVHAHPLHRWPSRRLAALFIVLFAALAVSSTSVSPAVADDGQRPAKPTGLEITTEAGSLDVSLDWDDVDGADDFLVRWRQAGPGNPLSEGETVTTSEATITVESHGEWVVRLEACNDNGCGKHLAQRFKVEPSSEPTPEPTPESTPTPEPTPDPVVEGASDDLSVSIVAYPASPAVGQAVLMAASISNAPDGGVPSYEWEMDFGYWLAMSTNSTFSYMAEAPETWNIRVTVSYDSGESATSDPVTIEWGAASGEGSGSDAGSQSEEDSESTNQAPVVDENAANHDGFTGTHNAPRGTLVHKSFDGIFSDPDGDTLTYTVSVPDDRDSLVSSLGINSDQDKVLFEYDDDGDWGAADPALPDPLSTTVTLTATDSNGATASITGKFQANWDSRPVLSEATVFTRSETESDPASSVLDLSFDRTLDTTSVPATSQFTVKAFNADSTSAGTIAVSSVTVRGRFVVLALATVPDDDLSLTVDYAPDADKPIVRSGGGDAAAGFTGQTVTNLTPVSDPEEQRAKATQGDGETATTLVSTGAQTRSDHDYYELWSFDAAQAFTTGSDSGGYNLTSLRLWMGQDGGTASLMFDVKICKASGDDPNTGDCLGTLTHPSSYATAGNDAPNEFTAPTGGIDLDPNTTYFVFVDSISGGRRLTLTLTNSDAEDAGAAAGWSIADGSRARQSTGSTWVGTGIAAHTFKMDIIGYSKGGARTLVSNTGQSDDDQLNVGTRDHAQQFTTGTASSGYALSAVNLQMSVSGFTATFTVSICPDSSGSPGTGCTQLTAPTSLTTGINTFSVPAGGISVDPSTAYWVVVDSSASSTGTTRLRSTDSGDEDTGAEPGWSIADTHLFRTRTATTWPTSSSSGSVRFAISGIVALDYDTDDDGLIEIGNADQLSAMRWDQDGAGTASSGNEASYAAAFPSASTTQCDKASTTGMVETCTGYELTADITLTGDWDPIGGDAGGWYRAVFDGNGHKIYGLRVNSPDQVRAGLFTGIGFGGGNGEVRNLGIIEPSITANGSSTNVPVAGALAGGVHGSVKSVYVRGGTVTSSNAGTSANLVLLGGLAGNLAHSGSIASSYSTAAVSSTAGNFNNTGGLVGFMLGNSATNRSTVTDSYAAGAVSNVSTSTTDSLGGLVGAMQEVMSGGNLVNFAEVNTSFYDSDVSGQSDTGRGTAKTTAEMLELGPSDFSATTALIFAAKEYPKLPFDSFDLSARLVSNVGKWSSPVQTVRTFQQFTTGSNTGNNDSFRLTAVQFDLTHGATAAVYTVTVHEDDNGQRASAVLGTLVNPGSLDADVDTFAATGGGITLDASTKYWVLVEVSNSQALTVGSTGDDGEDEGAATGWSLKDSAGGAYVPRMAVFGFESRTANIESVRITSLPKIDVNGDKVPETYRNGDVIEVTVTWDWDVTWNQGTGSIQLQLVFGDTGVATLANAASSTGTGTQMTFTHTVNTGSTGNTGLAVNPNVRLSGDATILDPSNENASLSFAALAAHLLHKVNNNQAADTTAPSVETGENATYVNGPAMTVSFNELLAGGQPAAAAFTVTADGFNRTVLGVQKSDHRLQIVLAQEVLFGETVTVSYNPANAGATSNRLQDRSGNEVAAFTNQAVNNLTPELLVVGTVTLARECTAQIYRGDSVAAEWDRDAGCDSVSRPGAYARYYRFAPGSDGKAITATLSSPDTDVWVYLWQGGEPVGSANSVGYARAELFSRITPGQNYIFEVTTSERARTGRFLLGLSGESTAVPPAQCRDTTELHATVHGNWGWPCASSSHPGSYARYHTFTVTAEQSVQFEVWSSQVSNVRMYLRQGTQGSGRVIATSHHPPVPNGGVRARMVAYLSPGTYTVETVAVNAGRTGALQFRTLQGPAQWTPPDQCVDTIPLDRNGNRVDATWGEPCWSNAHSGRHSRWYTFEVTERSQVSLTLLYHGDHDRDGVNTYVYLRGGRNFTGWAIAENDNDTDNHPDGIWWMRRAGWHWTSSAIDRVWLEPGTYTIEATSHIKLGYTILKHPTGAGPFSITFQRMD